MIMAVYVPSVNVMLHVCQVSILHCMYVECQCYTVCMLSVNVTLYVCMLSVNVTLYVCRVSKLM